jgi:inner membrane protein
MPSPLAHALVGAAVAWSADAARAEPIHANTRFSAAAFCAALAASPDVDLIYMPVHRMMTHSLVAAVLAGVVAAAWLGDGEARARWRLGLLAAVAYGSHILLDWLGADTKLPAGVQILWPFSDTWFISSWSLFRQIDLRGVFRPPIILSNMKSIAFELLVVGPPVLAVFLWRRYRLTAHRPRRVRLSVPTIVETRTE